MLLVFRLFCLAAFVDVWGGVGFLREKKKESAASSFLIVFS